MGGRDWHVSRAKHHKAAADHLKGTEWQDWAAVALFYSAHQWVHSSLADEATLAKDERHPRKHVSFDAPGHGGRGTNQLVSGLYADIYPAYMSLYEMSRRTRYDMHLLGPEMYPLLELQHKSVVEHCRALNAGRTKVPTQAP